MSYAGFGLVMFIAGLLLGGFWVFLDRRSKDLRAKEVEEAKAKAATARPAWISNLQPRSGTAGFTIAAALSGAGCLGRSAADEPVFVLCARDRVASMVVRDWVEMARRIGAKPEKLKDAAALADRMEEWRERHGGGKIPD